MNHPFALIKFEGPEASDFLQGQLTQDVRELERAGALLAAWCNPKGRVICVCRLLALDGGIGLAVPSAMANALVGRFTMFRLRAKVDIAIAAEWRITALAADADRAALDTLGLLPPGERLAVRRGHGLTAIALDERAVELYGRAAAIERAGLALRQPLSASEWQQALISAGIPTIDPETTEKYTPHMLNLDRLGGVSFHKGCYTGQEVVARTEHLGSVKRRLARYRFDGDAAPGDRLLHGERDAGEVVNTAAGHLLALVPVELHAEPLTIDGRTATPVPLP